MSCFKVNWGGLEVSKIYSEHPSAIHHIVLLKGSVGDSNGIERKFR